MLGEDIATELVNWFNDGDATYRADLRELNELNFGRFDAKVGERVAELRAEFAGRFARFEAKLDRVKSELRAWMFGFWVSAARKRAMNTLL